jgi:hypothetical protein
MTDKTQTNEQELAGAPSEHASFTIEDLQAINAAVSEAATTPSTDKMLRLLPVNPWRLYAFWSVAAEDWEAARAQLAPSEVPAVPVLRFFDFTPLSPSSQRPHPPFFVEVPMDRNASYVDLWKDAKTYVADLGVLRGDSFAAIVRSNLVDLPPATPSSELDFEWRLVKPLPEQDVEVTVASRPVPELFRGVFPRRGSEPEFPLVLPEKIGVSGTEAHSSLKEEDLPPLQTTDAMEPLPIESALTAPTTVCWAEGMPAPDGFSPDSFPIVECGEAGAAAATATERKALGAAGDNSVLLAAEHALMPEAAVETEPAESHSQPPSPSPLPLESVAAMSSFCFGPDADLEVNAELHVYGRARPGATLSLFGRPVAIGPDGRFSIRRPLSNGALVLPILLADQGEGGEK